MGVYHTAGISVSENTGEVYIVAGETALCPYAHLTTIVSVQVGESYGTHINQRCKNRRRKLCGAVQLQKRSG